MGVSLTCVSQILPDVEEFDMENILESMIEDCESRWGDGSDINTYSLRRR